MVIIKNYLKELKSLVLLEKNYEVQLIKKKLSGNRQARNKLIEANLSLVIEIAKQYSPVDTTVFQELVAQGNLMLVLGVDSFNPTIHVNLNDYLVQKIQGSMHIYLEAKNNIMQFELSLNVLNEVNIQSDAKNPLVLLSQEEEDNIVNDLLKLLSPKARDVLESRLDSTSIHQIAQEVTLRKQKNLIFSQSTLPSQSLKFLRQECKNLSLSWDKFSPKR